MPKAYDPAETEGPLYAYWMDRGYFKPNRDAPGEPFCIIMPPPNVTGELHLGHALTATIEDLLLAAEYILARGNSQVMLCERGIRTFDRALRNTLDISAVPYLKLETHLPVLVDPSHACGRRDLVPALALAAVAAGADGLLIEVHPDPDHARSDGDQSMRLDAFAELMDRVRDVTQALGRVVAEGPAPARR